MPETLTITQPDDWHVHLRQGDILANVIAHTADCFGRAMVMPNLSPPVVTAAQALKYQAEIMAALPDETEFRPLMSLYLTDNTRKSDVIEAGGLAQIVGFKLYPAGATTNSDSGVTRIDRIMPVLETMAKHGLVLQVHAEVTDPHVDIFDREAEFIEQVLDPLHRQIPDLRIILEHVTTADGVGFVQQAGDNIAATITVHHLMFNRNEIFRGGIRPHAYCLPVLKREHHRLALRKAATSGDKSFFLGTDSAPHTRQAKETGCGCAGIYSAHAAMALYTEVFTGMQALDRLEGFASHYGADFYGLRRNSGKITLQRKTWMVPAAYAGDQQSEIVPLQAGEVISWSIQ